MSDEELKAETRAAPQRERGPQKGGLFRYSHEGKRKGSRLDLRHGTLSRNLVQRTVAEAARYVG